MAKALSDTSGFYGFLTKRRKKFWEIAVPRYQLLPKRVSFLPHGAVKRCWDPAGSDVWPVA
jgi:hypothetical protein